MSDLDLSEQIENMRDDLSASALMESEIYSTHSSIELLDMKEEIYFEEVHFEAQKKWCVVEFDDGVQLVPLQWITNGNWCHFPNFKSFTRYEKAVKNYELSVSSWPTYAVKILGIYDSYDIAKKKLKEVEDRQDEESIERVRRRKRLAQSVEIDNPGDCRRRRYSASVRTAPSTPAETVVEPAPSSSYGLGNSSFEAIMLRSVNRINVMLHTAMVKIEMLQNSLCQLENFDKNGSTEDCDDIYFDMGVLPVKTIEELENFEEQLRDVNLQKQLIQRLKRIGGGDAKAFTVNILKTVFADEVCRLYSWSAGKAKKKFSALLLCKIIIEVVLSASPRDTEHKISEYIKNYLRHANDRVTRKQQQLTGIRVLNVGQDVDISWK